MAITKLSGGSTPADGSDPRTFPAIWNPTADVIDANESDIAALQALVGDNNLNDLNDVAITTPADGQFLVYDNGDWVNAVAAPPAILQVVQTVKTDTFSTSSTSYVDVTGLSATITPSSTSSKILVLSNAKVANTQNANFAYLALVRDSTFIYTGDASGSRDNEAQMSEFSSQDRTITTVDSVFLDSPATTSSVTYKIQLRANTSNAYLNRANLDNDASTSPRTASSITLMEVAG